MCVYVCMFKLAKKFFIEIFEGGAVVPLAPLDLPLEPLNVVFNFYDQQQ